MRCGRTGTARKRVAERTSSCPVLVFPYMFPRSEIAGVMRVLVSATAVGFLSASLAGVAVGGEGGKRVGSAGVSVSVPSHWQSIAQRTAPKGSGVVDPVTRIVTASARITFGRGCNELDYVIAPTAVALVLVEWVGPTPGAKWAPRPRRFTARNLPVRVRLLECFQGRGGGVQFAKLGRRFGAYVLAGRRASTPSVNRARAVLDTLGVAKRT